MEMQKWSLPAARLTCHRGRNMAGKDGGPESSFLPSFPAEKKTKGKKKNIKKPFIGKIHGATAGGQGTLGKGMKRSHIGAFL